MFYHSTGRVKSKNQLFPLIYFRLNTINFRGKRGNGVFHSPFSLSFFLIMNSEEKSTIEMQVTVAVDKKDETTQNTQTTPEKKDKDNKREKALDKAAINYRFSKKSAFGMILVAFAAVFGR